MPFQCVCCNSRVSQENRRPFHGITMRLFVSARRNMVLPDSGFICNTCRMSYRNWHNNAEFINILDHIEEESNDMIVDNDNIVRFSKSMDIITFCNYIFLE